MAQSTQIVPKYHFPYVDTVINDYTVYNEDAPGDVIDDSATKYIFAFTSGKGIDNRLIYKSSAAAIENAYGKSNFKKYGQPLMQAIAVAAIPTASVWCMRVMPENATYANKSVSLYYRMDTEDDIAVPSARKVRLKFLAKTLKKADQSGYTDISSLKKASMMFDGPASNGIYKDAENYIQIPGTLLMYSAGRGKYGNSYRIRMAQDTNYEKDMSIKYYNFEVLNVNNGLVKDATYTGSIVTSPKYTTTTLINDVLDEQAEGVVPVQIRVNEDGIEAFYDEFIAWLTDLVPELEDELAEKMTNYAIPDGMVDGRVAVTAEYSDKVADIRDVQEKLYYAQNPPTIDQMDVIFGHNVGSTEEVPFIFYTQTLTDDVDTEADDFNALDYTADQVVYLDNVTGLPLEGGYDGYFDTPRVEISENGTKQWTVEEEIEECYKNAYSGVYDRRILSSKRIYATAFWDANYPLSVKATMASLVTLRNDGILYLDSGIRSSFSTDSLRQIIEDNSVFNDFKVSKNVQHYKTVESSTNKRVEVTIVYFLAQQYALHVVNNGSHIPFVKTNCRLTGHVRDSLCPPIEDYEAELKETLYQNRLNYFERVDSNVFQRATQNTSQTLISDLLEESNVNTLYEAKRIIESDIENRLYDFADAGVRADFRQFELAKFNSWIGTRCESFDIKFQMNSWELEKSILHCYVDITFRGIQKRGILEIDINPRDFTTVAETVEE